MKEQFKLEECASVLQRLNDECECSAANFINTELRNTSSSSKMPTSTEFFRGNCFAGGLVQKLTLILYQKTMSLVEEILCVDLFFFCVCRKRQDSITAQLSEGRKTHCVSHKFFREQKLD